MVDTEAMVAMDMERERLKLMLQQSQVMDMVVMEDMDMADPMEVMVDIEAMEDMDTEREMLSQVMDMVDMDMEDLMEVMEDTEAMAMVVMVMESNEQSVQKEITIDLKTIIFSTEFILFQKNIAMF